MDRARRAEPYSNATIWTREIARNFAGHLDRLSKVHSCVDSASPKSSAHSKALPLKRAGQVSPLKPDRSASVHQASSDECDERAASSTADAVEDCATARDGIDGDAAAAATCGTPVRRRRPKALRKIKTVLKRTQLEAEPHHEGLSHPHENQRLAPDHSGPPSGHYDEYLEAPLPMPAHAKKGPPLDYHKRQEQQRIWHENQALAKRLRNTKPTLRSKEWQKDDQWNQSFLKTQERRRQALQHEMARTLASPHSALIRVKHVVHAPPSHLAGRPQTDHGLTDEGGVPTTVIEVTTQDAKTARDLRRRRSADEDATREHRQQSTAANHRRIMELRKQREQHERDGGDPGSHRDANGSASNGTGPPDELVSVRFTFSREGHRGLCTPNGVTGQFSPAVELEAALEASWHLNGDNDDHDALLLPVPTLVAPLSSRLDVADDVVDGGDPVFSALQACIDTVVCLAERDATMSAAEQLAARALEPELFEAPADSEVDRRVPLQQDVLQQTDEPAADRDVEYLVQKTPAVVVVPLDDPRPHDPPDIHGDRVLLDEPPEAPASTNKAEMSMASARQDPPTHEMEASGYGSEFDAEESLVAAGVAGVPPEPTGPEPPDQAPDEDDHEYEDDHADEHDEAPDHVLQHAREQEEPEPQYDDDLEPETQEDDDEPSYGDDGFNDDA